MTSHCNAVAAVLFVAFAGVLARQAHAQASQPDGAGLERGTLPASWSELGEGCDARPQFRLHEYNANLFILRQSGCTNYEKPFLYLLFGDGQALLFDSGARNADVATAVRAALTRWAGRHGGQLPRLVVAHSHAHGDHVAGDAQFAALPNTTVVGASPEAVAAYFGIGSWPNDVATFNLGGRLLDVVPIPGHERASIAIYDRRTGILLTGDTMYPGRLYVSDADAFTRSVRRLTDFASARTVSHVLGAHVEQTRTPYLDYPVGTKFQPDEHALELASGQLFELNLALAQMEGHVVRRAFRDFTVWPTAGTRAAVRPSSPDLDAVAKPYPLWSTMLSPRATRTDAPTTCSCAMIRFATASRSGEAGCTAARVPAVGQMVKSRNARRTTCPSIWASARFSSRSCPLASSSACSSAWNFVPTG